MGLKKHLKGTAALLTVAALTLALNGCGGKKEAKKFSVPVDKLPEGVISVIKPKPNKETLFVRALVQESVRRNYEAKLYNEALIHYDPRKGSAADHERLLKKAKAAWKSARDSASVAMFYAMGLSQLERTEGYDPYQKSKAMLTVPEIHLMPTVYAKENKLNTKEEVYSNIHGSYKVGIKKEIEQFPEGKQLLAISTMYHTDGKTACDIMKDVNPDYFNRGRSWEDISYDVAYRSANVAKTAGKVAGIGLAAVGTAAAATPAAIVAGGIAVTVKIVDTGLDAVQTSLVVLTGEEDKGLDKALKVTGTADTICSIATFDLTKPVFKGKTYGVRFKPEATFSDKLKGYAYLSKENLKSLPSSSLKDIILTKGLADEGNYNALGLVTGLVNLPKGSENNDKAIVVTGCETVDGRFETRTGVFEAIDKSFDTEENRKKAQALAAKIDDIIKRGKEEDEKKAAAATKSSQDLEKDAENVANAGGAGDYKNMFDMFIDSTRKGLIESILGPGGNMSDLDKILSEAAGEEMKATGLIISKDDKGNIKSVQVVGEKKNAGAPFAPSKVVGTYRVYVPKEKNHATVTVRDQGGRLSVSYKYQVEIDGKVSENAKVHAYGPYTPSYDPQTGRGQLGEYSFQFTNNGGQMSLTVR